MSKSTYHFARRKRAEFCCPVRRNRKIILNPGRTKLHRWQVALHEAGHAVAYRKIGGVWAKAHIFRDGAGVCFHPVVCDLFRDAVCIAVAKYCECGRWADSPPATRVRRSSVKAKVWPKKTPKSDEKALDLMYRMTALEHRHGVTKRPPLDPAEVEREAELFVWRNGGDILVMARRLFRDGQARVWPAKPRQITAGGIVLLGQQDYSIAAKAAEGN